MNLELFSFLPENFFWIPTIIILVYNFFSFSTASKTQKLLENKVLKSLRFSIRFIIIELSCFLFLNLIAMFLPVTHFNYESLIHDLLIYSSLSLLLINLLFIKFPKSKYMIKTKFFKFSINRSLLKPYTLVINVVLVIAIFMFIYSTTYYNVKTEYSLQSVKIYGLISEVLKIDSKASLLVVFISLADYFIFRMYLFPVFIYRTKKTNNELFDVLLENGKSLSNLRLVEIFSDYYVFSSNDINCSEHIIPKSKVLYLIKHYENNNIITNNKSYVG